MKKYILFISFLFIASYSHAGMSSSRDNSKVKKSGDRMTGALLAPRLDVSAGGYDAGFPNNFSSISSTTYGTGYINAYPAVSYETIAIRRGEAFGLTQMHLGFPLSNYADPIDAMYTYSDQFVIKINRGSPTFLYIDYLFNASWFDMANRYLTNASYINSNSYVYASTKFILPNTSVKQMDTNTIGVRDSADTAYCNFNAENANITHTLVVTSIVATNIYAEDIHVSSITVVTQKSTQTITDYLGSDNYNNVRMLDNLNLNGQIIYGGTIVDVGIQTSTTAETSNRIDANILIGQATGQAVSDYVSRDVLIGQATGQSTNDYIARDILIGQATGQAAADYINKDILIGQATGQAAAACLSRDVLIGQTTGQLASNKINDRLGVIVSSHIADGSIDNTKFSVIHTSFTIPLNFISTGVTTASMIGAVSTIVALTNDTEIYGWYALGNIAGNFTLTTSTAYPANTPVFGNSCVPTSASLVGTVFSSGTYSAPFRIIPAGYILRGVINTATTVDEINIGYLARKRL